MVVTSNADWDEAHPAGTSLDDVLQVRINSSSDFVHDGYDMGEYKYEFLQNYDYLKTIEKRPSELTAADMKMVYYSLTDFSSQTKSPVIVFTSAPTSDKDWSAEYPAGTSLNDKMGVRYVSYAEYIESGYPPGFDLGKDILYDKPLSALQPDDLRVVEYTPSSLSIYSFILYFTSVPDNPGEVHTFTVEFTTSDGMVKTASITCTPEVDPALQ